MGSIHHRKWGKHCIAVDGNARAARIYVQTAHDSRNSDTYPIPLAFGVSGEQVFLLIVHLIEGLMSGGNQANQSKSLGERR